VVGAELGDIARVEVVAVAHLFSLHRLMSRTGPNYPLLNRRTVTSVNG
jgi:hypothetical protein